MKPTTTLTLTNEEGLSTTYQLRQDVEVHAYGRWRQGKVTRLGISRVTVEYQRNARGDLSTKAFSGSYVRHPHPRCAACDGSCTWADDAWVCDDCGSEWYPSHGPEYTEIGGLGVVPSSNVEVVIAPTELKGFEHG